MLKVYQLQLALLTTLITTYILITTFNYSFTGLLTLPDLYARTNSNETPINHFFFFWTSLTYLPSFFFAIALITFNHSTNHLKSGYVNFAILLSLVYNIEFVDFQVVSSVMGVFDTTLTSFNFLLTNNLNKYHPFIFYVSAILGLTLSTRIFFSHNTHPIFSHSATLKELRSTTQSVVWINLFALYLGSWWALQEGTWGGWWNWDASEVFGLLFALFTLRIVHTTVQLSTLSVVHTWVRLLMYLLVLVYFFIQLNFDLVSHNFGAKFFFFFSNNLFFIEVLTFTAWAVVTLLLRHIVDTNQWWLTDYRSTFYTKPSLITRTPVLWLVPTFYLFVVVLMLNSFLPLLNYFWWNFFKINLFNTEVYSLTLLILVIYALTWLTRTYTSTSFPSLSLICWESPLALLITTWTRELSVVSNLHLVLLTFFVVNIYSHNTSFIYFYTLDVAEVLLFDSKIFYPTSPSLSCDNFEIATSLNYITALDGLTISNYNLIYHANTPLINSFTLLTNHETTLNLYHLARTSLAVALYIESPLLTLLNIATLTSLPLFYWIARTSVTK